MSTLDAANWCFPSWWWWPCGEFLVTKTAGLSKGRPQVTFTTQLRTTTRTKFNQRCILILYTLTLIYNYCLLFVCVCMCWVTTRWVVVKILTLYFNLLMVLFYVKSLSFFSLLLYLPFTSLLFLITLHSLSLSLSNLLLLLSL